MMKTAAKINKSSSSEDEEEERNFREMKEQIEHEKKEMLERA